MRRRSQSVTDPAARSARPPWLTPYGPGHTARVDEGTYDRPPVCSAKGCRAPARWLLVWNNPRLHTPDREKTWSACEEHRGSLSAHLDVRGFLRRVDPLPPAEPGEPDR